jgi:hypothetical protein
MCLGVESFSLVLNVMFRTLGWIWMRWLGVFIAPNHFHNRWWRLLAMGAPDSSMHHRTATVHCPVRATSAQPLGFGAGRPLEPLSSCCTGQSGALWLCCSDFCRGTVAHCTFLQSRPLAQRVVVPLAHRTVRWNIAERVFKFPRVTGLELYDPGAPDTVRWHTGQSDAPSFSTLKGFAPVFYWVPYLISFLVYF